MALVLCLVLNAFAQDPMTQSIEDLQNGIEKQHRAYFYVLAMKLFKVGRKEDAVLWFYAGPLRYRVYLKVNEGRPLNEYAFGDIPQLVKTIDAVIAWDRSHSNQLTPHDKRRSQYDEIMFGLAKLRDETVRNADSIRKARSAAGLENRN